MASSDSTFWQRAEATAAARFVSRQHPRGAPWALVWGRALVRPIAACVLPVMIVTLVAVLEEAYVLPFVWIGFPAALLAAVVWTYVRLSTTLAEVYVQGGWAAVRTVTESLREARMFNWQPVLDLRRSDAGVVVAVGLESYELADTDWPEAQRLAVALQGARASIRGMVNPESGVLSRES